MKFPSGVKYQEALQNPQIALQSPSLKNYKPDKNPMGMVALWSGGNAATFRITQGNHIIALRCFTRYIDDRDRRLIAISAFLQNQPSPPFTPITYQTDGILLPDGTRYPIVYMPWVQGEPLHKYIDQNIRNGLSFSTLADQFRRIIETLARLNVAHGDLQHGNIMVSNNQLILIDYDGMYLPQLKGLRNPESGHEHYQHPARNDEFDPNLDRFSSIVIYLAFQALEQQRAFWHKYSPGGENLLFKKNDFLAPDKSPLLTDLQSIASLAPLITRFRTVCKGSLEQIPTLQDFLTNQAVAVTPSKDWQVARRVGQFLVIPAQDRKTLLDNLGERVVVIGKITEVYEALDIRGKPYAKLNFGNFHKGCFTLVLWSKALKLFNDRGFAPSTYQDKWVRVTGVLSSHQDRQGRGSERPQIEIETPLEIEVLSGEAEAKERLVGDVYTPPTPSPNTARPKTPQKNTTEEIMAQIYGNRGTASNTSTSTVPAPTTAPTYVAIPKLSVSTTEVNIGWIPRSGLLRRAKCTITNTGTGVLTGSVEDIPPWVHLEPRNFQCKHGENCTITITVAGSKLNNITVLRKEQHTTEIHEHFSAGIGVIKSNGGTAGLTLLGVLTSLASQHSQPTAQPGPTVSPIPQPQPIAQVAPTVATASDQYLVSPILDFGQIQAGKILTVPLKVKNPETKLVRFVPWRESPGVSLFPYGLNCRSGDSDEFEVTIVADRLPPTAKVGEYISGQYRFTQLRFTLCLLQCDIKTIQVPAQGILVSPVSISVPHSPTSPKATPAIGAVPVQSPAQPAHYRSQIAQPQFEVVPLTVDFGTVYPSTIQARQLQLTSISSTPFDVTVTCLVTWIQLAQTRVHLSPGESKSISLQLHAERIPDHLLTVVERTPTAITYQLNTQILQLHTASVSHTVSAMATLHVPLIPPILGSSMPRPASQQPVIQSILQVARRVPRILWVIVILFLIWITLSITMLVLNTA